MKIYLTDKESLPLLCEGERLFNQRVAVVDDLDLGTTLGSLYGCQQLSPAMRQGVSEILGRF